MTTEQNPPSMQPAPATEQAISDDTIELLALKHVDKYWTRDVAEMAAKPAYQSTEQFSRLKSFALDLLATQAERVQAMPSETRMIAGVEGLDTLTTYGSPHGTLIRLADAKCILAARERVQSSESIDLDKLEALARAATPGEWVAHKFGRVVGGPPRQYVNGSAQAQIASFSVTFHDQAPEDEPERQQANADFCAALHPDVALKLIALARRATASKAEADAITLLRAACTAAYKDLEHACEDGNCWYAATDVVKAALDATSGQSKAEAPAGACNAALRAAPAIPVIAGTSTSSNEVAPGLIVWYGSMPESNGKSNYTATLMRKGASLFDTNQYTFARSEYPDRVRYEADCMRYLIGELPDNPCILDYDTDKHSGYIEPENLAANIKQGGVA